MTTTSASDSKITPRRGHPTVTGIRCDFQVGLEDTCGCTHKKKRKRIFLPAKDNSTIFINCNELTDVRYIKENMRSCRLSVLQVPTMDLEKIMPKECQNYDYAVIMH